MASSEFEASTPYFITDEWFHNATFAAAGIKKDNVKEKEKIKVGDRVKLKKDDGRLGKVKFVGGIGAMAHTFVGIEWKKPVGKHDGTFRGKRYFKCKHKHGSFRRIRDVEVANEYGKLERGFAGPDIFVTEGKLKNNPGVYGSSECTFGTSVLLQNPSTWGEQDKSMRRFVITAADCVSKPRAGRKKGVVRVDELRLRVPIRPWEDFPDDVKYYRPGAEETQHLYDEINIHKSNVFINEKFGIAMIAIPEMAPSVDATTHYFDIAGNSPSESMSWISVNGFPAEYNPDGHWDTHIPHLSKLCRFEDEEEDWRLDLRKSKKSKARLLDYRLETKPGICGGPVIMDDVVIGIHNAAESKNVGYGTLFTNNLKSWMKKIYSKWDKRLGQYFPPQQALDEDSVVLISRIPAYNSPRNNAGHKKKRAMSMSKSPRWHTQKREMEEMMERQKFQMEKLEQQRLQMARQKQEMEERMAEMAEAMERQQREFNEERKKFRFKISYSKPTRSDGLLPTNFEDEGKFTFKEETEDRKEEEEEVLDWELPLPSDQLYQQSSELTDMLEGDVPSIRYICREPEFDFEDIADRDVLHTLKRHSKSVEAICLHPEERFLFSGSRDNKIIMWDLETCKDVKTFQGHQDGVSFVTMLKTGKLLTGGRDGLVKKWNVQSGQCIHTMKVGSPCCSISMSPIENDALIGISENGGNKRTTLLVDVVLLKEKRRFEGHDAKISNDENYIFAATNYRKSITVYEIDTKSYALDADLLMTIQYGKPIYSLAVTNDSSMVIAGSHKGTIVVWEVMKGVRVHTLKEAHTRKISGLSLTKNEDHLLSVSEDKTIKMWRMKDATLVASWKGLDGFLCVTLNRDDSRFFTGSFGNAIDVRCLKNVQKEREIGLENKRNPFGLGSRSGRSTFNMLKGHSDRVGVICLDPEERYIFSGSSDEKIIMWNLETYDKVKTFEGHEAEVKFINVLRNGFLLSGDDEGEIKKWNIKSGACVQTMTSGAGCESISITSDERIAAVGISQDFEDSTILVDIKALEAKESFSRDWNASYFLDIHDYSTTFPGWHATITSDDTRIFAATNRRREITIYDMANMTAINTIQYGSRICRLVVTKGASVLVTSSERGEIVMWNVEDGTRMRTLKGAHSDYVNSLNLTNKQKYLISTSEDKTIKIWKMKNAQCIATLKAVDQFLCAALLANDSHFFTGSRGNAIKVWNLRRNYE